MSPETPCREGFIRCNREVHTKKQRVAGLYSCIQGGVRVQEKLLDASLGRVLDLRERPKQAKQAEPDGHLHQHRPDTSSGASTVFLLKSTHFRLQHLWIVFVFGLDSLHLWLHQ